VSHKVVQKTTTMCEIRPLAMFGNCNVLLTMDKLQLHDGLQKSLLLV